MDINRYLVTSVYLDYGFSVNYQTPLHELLEKIPELKDIAQKIEGLLGISKVYHMHVFSEAPRLRRACAAPARHADARPR